ncbi:hypothetical protein HJC23_013910 [Cyclotella cryptica]|uniref:Uncharacterized protein n=1 Tax=Cyclotella cryptica TaxID=29204 RepID=A0ABD3QNY2_9STRA|eukprot:CCRYP_005503-RA/>CCRYP_005503-RA protein AED:0.02 eAED:0.01 QI:225/1/0.5/1/1/1/2/0/662
MKFNLFHHGGGTPQPATTNEIAQERMDEAKLAAEDEPAPLTNKEEATRDSSLHTSTVVTMANKPADSDVIIEKVDGIYKEFIVFQSNLKKLLSLYKEEHSAMKTLNEKRFDAAKTLDLMFGNSPLSSAVAHGSPSAPPPRAFFSDSLLNTVGREEENETNGDEEVVARDRSGGSNPFEEDVKIVPSDAPQSNERGAEKQLTSDVPDFDMEEEQSLSLQTVDHPTDPLVDPPADVEIPDDYPKDECRKITSAILSGGTDTGGGLNVIIDDEDDMHAGAEYKPGEKKDSARSVDPEVVGEPTGSKEVTTSVINYCDVMNNEEDGQDPRGEKEEAPPSESYCESNGPYSKINAEPIGQKDSDRSKSIVYCESKGSMMKDDSDDEDEEYEAIGNDVEKNDRKEDVESVVEPEPEITVEDEQEDSSVEKEASLSNDEENDVNQGAGKTEASTLVSPEKDYFLTVSPAAALGKNFRQSYYDVHEVNYMESKKYLEQHSNLVKYIEDWERILFQRVNALYTEYMKHRKNLHHYIKKVDSLKKEMAKLQKASEEKDKPIPPKKVEKLERNVVKLAGARETHDNSGESLFLFLDEVVNRSWRDIFPLLQRTVKFEQDYSLMQAKTFQRLTGTTELLDLIGRNKSISMSSRLKSLKTLHPEVIYSGEDVSRV